MPPNLPLRKGKPEVRGKDSRIQVQPRQRKRQPRRGRKAEPILRPYYKGLFQQWTFGEKARSRKTGNNIRSWIFCPALRQQTLLPPESLQGWNHQGIAAEVKSPRSKGTSHRHAGSPANRPKPRRSRRNRTGVARKPRPGPSAGRPEGMMRGVAERAGAAANIWTPGPLGG